jgi:hypothetical protein
MTGCLTFPLRVAASLVLIVALAAGWFFRDDLSRFGRRQLGLAEPPSPIGFAEAGGAARARVRMDSLQRAGVDSVIIAPAELASLVAEELQRTAAGAPDSVSVELRDREVAIRGQVSTDPIPAALREILGGVLNPREEVELAGPLGLQRAGVGEFEVRRVRVKGFPVPREMLDRLIGRYVPRRSGAAVLFDVPAHITGIRVTPRGVILYGGTPR